MNMDEDICIMIESIKRISAKIFDNLAEALERTPSLVSSKPLIENSLKLSASLINISLEMSSKIPCSKAKEH